MIDTPTPGQRLARGVCRGLRSLDFACVTELTLASGLRADVAAVGPRGEIWIVECKSSRLDFASDRKWAGYGEWCDRFFWAVDAAFPVEILPEGSGLILADGYWADIARMAPETPLAGARRKALMLRIARASAGRLRLLLDPGSGDPELL